ECRRDIAERSTRGRMAERGFAVIGLGYVGLPVALALAKRFAPVCGFDISQKRVAELRGGIDRTREVSDQELLASTLRVTADPAAIANTSFFVVSVPTPIDASKRPNLRALTAACELIGSVLRKGSVVVFESTVYP